MSVSDCATHYFFGGGLCLRVGTALRWSWFYRPILSDYVAVSRNGCVQTTERTDVDQTLHIVPKHAIHNTLCTANSAALMVMGASLHRRAYVIDDLGACNGSVDGGGVSQIAEKNLDVAIVHELRLRLSSNENANSVSVL